MREFLFTLLILHNCLALVIRSELPTYSPFYFFPFPHYPPPSLPLLLLPFPS